MFGDKSPRTSRVSKYAISTAVATGMILVGSIFYVGETFHYKHDLAHSSTPIGQSLTFNRSQSAFKVKGLYTDKNQDVLIAQISTKEANELPFKGSDYKVMIQSESTKGLHDIPILFGRMSTDGDMFLILPNPTDAVYSIFILNTNYIGTSDISGEATTDDGSELDSASITEAISNYSMNQGGENEGTYVIKSNRSDIASMRLTLKPAFETPAYMPQVIDAPLLKDKGDSQEFDFETLFNTLYREPTIKSQKAKYERLAKELSQLKKALTAQEERLAANPDDSDAQEAISGLNDKINAKNQSIQATSRKLARFETLQFDPAMFQDMQTTAIIAN